MYKTVFSRFVSLNYTPLYPPSKNVHPHLIFLVAPTVQDCPAPSSKSLEETRQMGGRILPSSKKKKLLISRTRRTPRPSPYPSPNSNFHVITQCKIHLQQQSLLLYHLTSGFMYRYIMLILINRWLLNLIFSMAKALDGQSSSKQSF